MWVPWQSKTVSMFEAIFCVMILPTLDAGEDRESSNFFECP